MIFKPTRREFLKYAGIGALAFGVPMLLPKRAFAAWDKGFDFRATAGFVTDPADCTYVLISDTSPTTRNGATFVWTNTGGLDSRDRTTSGDTRLSGINFATANATWTLTLPGAGVYDIWMACGDAAAGQTIRHLQNAVNSDFVPACEEVF